MARPWRLSWDRRGRIVHLQKAVSCCRRAPTVDTPRWNPTAELIDPYVGSAIKAEAGLSYVVVSYIAIAISIVLVVFGTVQGWKRRRQLTVNSR